jgi:hypothetical protein
MKSNPPKPISLAGKEKLPASSFLQIVLNIPLKDEKLHFQLPPKRIQILQQKNEKKL